MISDLRNRDFFIQKGISINITWRIISKLKDWPFHKVNSPLCEPVIRRRPVGVHFYRKVIEDVR